MGRCSYEKDATHFTPLKWYIAPKTSLKKWGCSYEKDATHFTPLKWYISPKISLKKWGTAAMPLLVSKDATH